MKTATQTCECPRCCGRGHIEAFRGIADGVCFQCGGSGKVAFRKTRINKFSAINAMHCKTLAEAHAFRLEQFAVRFPELVSAMEANPEVKYWIKNGMGYLKDLVAKLA